MRCCCFVFMSGVLLAGCGVIPRPTGKTLFVLNAPSCSGKESSRGPTILLSDIESSVFLDSNRIVYSSSADTRAAYQLAAWVEPLPQALGRAVAKRLRCEGIARAVEERSSMVRTDLQLRFQLEEFYHDANPAPGSVRLQISGELVDLQSRSPISQRYFEVEEPIEAEGNTETTVAAFERALHRFLNEMSIWLRDHLARAVKN